jgi:YHS domain-containing protein
MFKKVLVLSVLAVFVCGSAFTMCGVCGSGESGAAKEEKTAAVKVNNTVCPITGEKVDMNNPATVEYKGKIYNLCCPACAKGFNADPEKYSAKAEQGL